MIIRLLHTLYDKALGRVDIPFAISFTDGTVYRNRIGPPEIEIRYLKKRAELNTLLFQGVGLVESYIHRELNIAGDIKLLVRAFEDGVRSCFMPGSNTGPWVQTTV